MIKPKLKICSACGVPSVLWKSVPKLCKDCSGKLKQAEKPKEIKPRTPIKPVSDKKAKLDKAYSILRKEYLKYHPYCAVNHFCTFTTEATDIHHKRGRGEYLLDTSTWLPVCREDHQWLENNPTIAKELGYSENRLDKY